MFKKRKRIFFATKENKRLEGKNEGKKDKESFREVENKRMIEMKNNKLMSDKRKK